jgi:hypothetical protein
MYSLSCPQCTLPVTVLDCFTLETSEGEPVEHVRISCPASHHFLMACDRLSTTVPAAESALVSAVLFNA